MGSGFTTFAQSLGALAQGRHTPMGSTMSNEEYHKQKTKLVGMLKDISVADANIKQAQVTGYVSAKTAIVQGQANVLGSLAEFAKASGMAKQAQADMSGHLLKKMAESSTAIGLALPDEKVLAQIQVAAEVAATAAPSAIADERWNEALKMGPDGGVNKAAVLEILKTSPLTAYVTSNNVEINKMAPDDPLRYATAQAAEQVGGRAVQTILAGVEQSRGLPAGTLTSMAQEANDLILKPAFTGHPSVAPMKEASEQAREQAQATVAQFYEDVEEVGRGFGAPKEVMDTIKAEWKSLGDITKTPLVFGQSMKDIPSNAGIDESKAFVKQMISELERDRTTPDPLEAALGRWYAMPGFTSYKEAMDFPTAEKAAMYASKNPNEYVRFLGWVKEKPELLNDTMALRSMLAEHGRSTQVAGGPVGYFTKRSERTFGTRIPGGAGGLTGEQQDAMAAVGAGAVTDPEFEALPEAPDGAAPPAASAPAPSGPIDFGDDPGSKSSLDELRESVRATSPHYVNNPNSRVAEVNGQTLQELDDGAIVFLDGQFAGRRVQPGDHLWATLATQIEQRNGMWVPDAIPAREQGSNANPQPIPTVLDTPPRSPSPSGAGKGSSPSKAGAAPAPPPAAVKPAPAPSTAASSTPKDEEKEDDVEADLDAFEKEYADANP